MRKAAGFRRSATPGCEEVPRQRGIHVVNPKLDGSGFSDAAVTKKTPPESGVRCGPLLILYYLLAPADSESDESEAEKCERGWRRNFRKEATDLPAPKHG